MPPNKTHTRYLHYVPGRRTKAALVATALACFGLLALQASSATTSSVTVEAETGTASGAASAISDSSASNGQAVTFGSTGKPTTPYGLKAFPGGDSLAIRWIGSTASSGQIKEYRIIRDGTQIATVTPGFHIEFPEKDGNGFIDKTAEAGQAYQYQVQAVNMAGLESSLSAVLATAQPLNTTPVPTINIDANGIADLEAWLADTAVPFLKTWYPKVSNLLAYPDYTPMGTYTLRLDPTLDQIGVPANTNFSNGLINISPKYVREHPNDIAFLLHESVHVIQSQATVAGNNTPFWLLKGVADLYSRDYVLHSRNIDEVKPQPDSTGYYTDASAAYFLNWIHTNYDSTYARKVTINGHNNAFSYTDLQVADGKNIDELYSQMLGIPPRTGPFISHHSQKCIDVSAGLTAPRTKVQLWDCNQMIAQKITAWPHDDGTMALHVLGSCLDIEGAGVANGTQVWLWPCIRNGDAQKWTIRGDGSIINPKSGRCLEINGAGSGGANGTQIQIWDCNGGTWQKWTVPANTPVQ